MRRLLLPALLALLLTGCASRRKAARCSTEVTRTTAVTESLSRSTWQRVDVAALLEAQGLTVQIEADSIDIHHADTDAPAVRLHRPRVTIRADTLTAIRQEVRTETDSLEAVTGTSALEHVTDNEQVTETTTPQGGRSCLWVALILLAAAAALRYIYRRIRAT